MDHEGLYDTLRLNKLPAAFRGIIFNLALYHNSGQPPIKELQKFVDCQKVTGRVNAETCKKAENMVQYKGSGREALNAFCEHLQETQKNGALYRISQFMSIDTASAGKGKRKDTIEFITYNGELKDG